MIRREIDIGFVKSPGVINNIGTKIEIKFRLNISDKGVCFVIGDHNGQPFVSCISFKRNGVYSQTNLIGSLGIASTTLTNDNSMVIRCNTNKYGTCTVMATVPIEYIKFTN